MSAGAADDLAVVSEDSYAEFMASEVLGEEDLADGAEIQRRYFNRITPPGASLLQPMFPSVMPFDDSDFSDAFLDGLLGEGKNSVAIYPLSLVLDPTTRETLVYNAEGSLIASIPSDGRSRAWPEDADPARITLLLDLLPSEDVEPFLYVGERAAKPSRTAKSTASGGMSLMSLSAGQFGIASIQKQTNGAMRLVATNGTGTGEVYAFTVLHTSTVSIVTWTNDENVVITDTNTIWWLASPSYNGVDEPWECQTTNLVFTNGVATWDDENISTNARQRFYAVALLTDTDGDGLTDGAEFFVHHTNRENPDTDGDGWSDAEELAEATDPLDRFSATHLARGVVLNEVLYDATGTDASNEWIEIYSAGRYPVDLGGFVIQVAENTFTNAYSFPSNTWIDPGRFLLLGGSLVTNRDLEVNFTMPNRFTNEATAAVRIAAENGTNILVADCLMYGGNAANFNSNGLDTTGWISTNARSAGAGNSLVRLFIGHDTDQVLDWQWTSGPVANSSIEIPDTDNDGLTDQEELTGSENPHSQPTNPLKADSDGDGLSDYAECVTHGTDPNTWATDGDLFPWPPTNNIAVSNWWGSDSYETAHGWNPLVADQNTNGIPDSWEMAFTNLNGDADSDGISNLDELEQNSNPFDSNSTNAQPYVLRFESSKSGWTNSGLIDVGLEGWVKVYFEGIKTNLSVCVWVVEGQTQEEFQVTWAEATNSTVTWFNENREVITGASLAPGPCPYLLIQDSGLHPEYTNTLGGEYKIVAIQVQIIGFSLAPTWARSTACVLSNHQSSCIATTLPQSAFALTYSVQGDSHGASIDAVSGVVTPATNDSGTINVRAALTLLPSCFAESNLLIRARPTSIASSSVNTSGPYYGGQWTHTFNGTGGSLDGVEISETVQTQLPNPFGWSLNISPGPPNVWYLDSGGVMNTPDSYWTHTSWINATNYLPSPPKAGVPQTGTDHQWYHWKCSLCGNAWQQFTGPENIDVTLMYSGTNLIVRTSAYGQSTDDAYVGPMP